MRNDLFAELEQSLNEAVAISKGELKPARVTVIEIPDVKAIRETLGLSREEFAEGISTSKETIKSWELRRRNPTGLTLKILKLIEQQPSIYALISKR